MNRGDNRIACNDLSKRRMRKLPNPGFVGSLSAIAVCAAMFLVSADGIVIALATYASGMTIGHVTRYFVRKRRLPKKRERNCREVH